MKQFTNNSIDASFGNNISVPSGFNIIGAIGFLLTEHALNFLFKVVKQSLANRLNCEGKRTEKSFLKQQNKEYKNETLETSYQNDRSKINQTFSVAVELVDHATLHTF